MKLLVQVKGICALERPLLQCRFLGLFIPLVSPAMSAKLKLIVDGLLPGKAGLRLEAMGHVSLDGGLQ